MPWDRMVWLCSERILTRALWWYRSCGHTERGSLPIGDPFLASEGCVFFSIRERMGLSGEDGKCVSNFW